MTPPTINASGSEFCTNLGNIILLIFILGIEPFHKLDARFNTNHGVFEVEVASLASCSFFSRW
jgi:hypothetical protein